MGIHFILSVKANGTYILKYFNTYITTNLAKIGLQHLRLGNFHKIECLIQQSRFNVIFFAFVIFFDSKFGLLTFTDFKFEVVTGNIFEIDFQCLELKYHFCILLKY